MRPKEGEGPSQGPDPDDCSLGGGRLEGGGARHRTSVVILPKSKGIGLPSIDFMSPLFKVQIVSVAAQRGKI